MIIHFVCKGNTYRSRLAEAYLNSKELKNVKSISSGIEADKNISGTISWYAQRIIQKNKLVKYESKSWQRTTKALLEKADLNIFMEKSIYDFCKNKLGFDASDYEIWDIYDVNHFVSGKIEEENIKVTEETFGKIKKMADKLASRI